MTTISSGFNQFSIEDSNFEEEKVVIPDDVSTDSEFDYEDLDDVAPKNLTRNKSYPQKLTKTIGKKDNKHLNTKKKTHLSMEEVSTLIEKITCLTVTEPTTITPPNS